MNIVILAIRQDKAEFFCRIAAQLKNSHDITFLTTRYHTFLYIKRRHFKVKMLQDFIVPDTEISEFETIKDEACRIELACHMLTKKTIERQFKWLCQGFVNYFHNHTIDLIIIWNGSMMQGHIASAIAERFQIKKLFFEIGNFPNRLFVDEKGVNARSSLAERDLSICPDYNHDRLMDYLSRHKEEKENVHMVPQAKALQKINWLTLLDCWYNLFNKYPVYEGYPSAFSQWKQHYFAKKTQIPFDNIRLENHSYILFPLQVSTDSQIIRNSDIPLIEALKYAIQQANQNKCDLLIKPHPVESNREVFDFIEKQRRSNPNLYVVNNNTYQLIRHCQKVITINSTVGIEGLMYYKHVEVLGKALYKPYCQPDLSEPIEHDRVNRFLYNYLFNCLQEGDFFNSGPVQLYL